MYFGFLFAGFWFTNLVALMRFMQVCVWKRVVEINEDLGFRIASLSVFSGSYGGGIKKWTISLKPQI